MLLQSLPRRIASRSAAPCVVVAHFHMGRTSFRSGAPPTRTTAGELAPSHVVRLKTTLRDCRGFASSSSSSSSSSSESFLSGSVSPYVEYMFAAWQKDPSSVHASWDSYFRNLAAGVAPEHAFVAAPEHRGQSITAQPQPRAPQPTTVLPPPGVVTESVSRRAVNTAFDTSKVIQLVRGYQSRGHEFARIDPLGLPHGIPFVSTARHDARKLPISYESYGFTESDLDRKFDCRVPGVTGFLSAERSPLTLRELVRRLEETYCGSIGIEAMHIEDPSVLNYLRQALEGEDQFEFDAEMKRRILNRTMRSQLFEEFCGHKFNTSKRFGVDGCETAIVALKAITKKAVTLGVKSVVIGMPHRGRLNTLVNVLHKPMEKMMLEFQGVTGWDGSFVWGQTGDVKYHLGVDYTHFDVDAQKHIHMAVLANPSHLEAVAPFVVGQARAQQYFLGDLERSQVLPITCHGDASFSGQGVVYESLQMSQLPSYTVGGTIHLIVNNQIGFTTDVIDQGSGRYCTDLAKCIEAPVFHVNADDPEAVTYVANLALDFRQKFHSDVFINLVGYRRFGHNELDMPKFTQPMMYNLIEQHPSVLDIYAKKLIDEGVVTQQYVDEVRKDILAFYNAQYEASRVVATAPRPKPSTVVCRPQWKSMASPEETVPPRPTAVPLTKLKELGGFISKLPEAFKPHVVIGRVYKAREDAIQSGANIDLGFAEALAFATLLSEGFHVRLSGQDAQRGTFSHRHAVVHDQSVYGKYCPLQELAKKYNFPHKFEVNNSPLSEYASLGYEVAYSMEHPDILAIWEAQFGDFANGAQIVIDQFIAAGETKWGSQSGVVLLLPHGYDGQGPEHSSCRIERFLQLCDDREDVIHPETWNLEKRAVIQRHNFQVVNCTTPANFFHVLRRQMLRGFRKPLIVISPKRMLKMRTTFSRLEELAEGSTFHDYLANISVPEAERPSFVKPTHHLPVDASIERLVLCSGQVYYDLAAYREKHKAWSVGLARVEQLSPFPYDRVIDDIQRYPNLRSVVWAQEEPMNAGPWPYVSKRLVSSLQHLGCPKGISQPLYVGRDVMAAPCGGDPGVHQRELDTLLRDAFDVERKTNSYYEKYLQENAVQTPTGKKNAQKRSEKRGGDI